LLAKRQSFGQKECENEIKNFAFQDAQLAFASNLPQAKMTDSLSQKRKELETAELTSSKVLDNEKT
jgi:hypothetical protein